MIIIKKIFHFILFIRIWILQYIYKKNLVVLDIDNTLSKTREYVQLHANYDWLEFEAHEAMRDFVENHYIQNKNDTIYIALTVRPIMSYNKTKIWLKKNFEFRFFTCFASNQSIKVSLVKRLVKVSGNTLFIDDFTYGEYQVRYFWEERCDIEDFQRNNKNFVYIDPREISSWL